jgi:hypothetical protein
MSLLRYLDVLVLAVALVLFVVAELPLGGWLLGAAVWAVWRGIGEVAERRAAASRDPRAVAGIATASMIGRGWLMGLTLLGVGLVAGDDVGLTAALLCVVLFTVSFTTRIVLRPFSPSP